jgi:guanyl-specific ribonuclease Sa
MLREAWFDSFEDLKDFGEARLSVLRSALDASRARLEEAERIADAWVKFFEHEASTALGAMTPEQVAATFDLGALSYADLRSSDSGGADFYWNMTVEHFVDSLIVGNTPTSNRRRSMAESLLWTDAMRRMAADNRGQESPQRRANYVRAVHEFGSAFSSSDGQAARQTALEKHIQLIEIYRDVARSYVGGTQGLDHREDRLRMIEAADRALDQTKEYAAQRYDAKARIAAQIGVALLDLSLSIVPGVSWAKDVHEAVTGRNLVTGEELDRTDYVFAVIGAVTVGVGSKVKVAKEAIEVIHDVGLAVRRGEDAAEAARIGEKAAEAASEAEKILGSAKALGWKGSKESFEDMGHVVTSLEKSGKLPPNYITKNEAKEMGWVQSKGNLGDVAPGKRIGGDVFENRKGLLPRDKTYLEADLGYRMGYRGTERIVYSSDCRNIYITDNHYKTFETIK